ncbi:MAG: MFS transporter [Chloroflexi bacterium]|nr:MFS transporter [Chloroflexota bacterium]
MPKLDQVAASIAFLVTASLAVLIVLGSSFLRFFDAALVGYAVATVFAVLGITYRFVQWLRRPPTRLYWVRGWQLFASWRNFRRYGLLIPRAIISDLVTQEFIWPRSAYRWVMHFNLFWGVVLASMITFPLVFGWLHFRLVGAADYQLYVFGFPTIVFPIQSVWGFLMLHALNITAVMVIAGVGMAMWRRWRDREVMSEQEFGFDFAPLFLLLTISVSGLLLTASQLLWRGSFYWFLALAHQIVVVAAILYIPFGKFWHVLERPASIGIRLYKEAHMAEAPQACIGCGRQYASRQFVADLKDTLRALDQDYGIAADGAWLQDFCPTCKRVLRGNSYFASTQREFL